MSFAGDGIRLSVVIPAFNAGNALAEQLESLATQTFAEPFEVVIADNGSTDDTRGICERFRSRLHKLVVLEATGERGPAFARNTGIAAAQSDVILTLDQDDLAASDYVERMAKALEDHNWVAGRLDYLRLNPTWSLPFGELLQSESIQTYMAHLPAAATCVMGFHRSLWEKVSGFDNRMRLGDDIDFCWRAIAAGEEIHFEPAAVVHYRLRHTIRARYRQGLGYGESRAEIIARYHPPRPPGPASSARQPSALTRLIKNAVREPRRTAMSTAGLIGGKLGERRANQARAAAERS